MDWLKTLNQITIIALGTCLGQIFFVIFVYSVITVLGLSLFSLITR
jgi:hypothetical protein